MEDSRSADKLVMLAKDFNKNRSGKALEYFKELNRQGKFNTVIRVYLQNEEELRQGFDSKKVEDQYNYAKDTIEYLKKSKYRHGMKSVKKGEGSAGIFSSGFSQRFFQSILISFVGCIGLTACLYLLRNGLGRMEKVNFDVKMAKDVDQRLNDVKGIDEIREEVDNIIRVVKNPDKYREKGAKLFKGVLLFGEPGTGKTLLARAIAGEAGCNFIFCTGSDFDEMFVGVGAKRVRQLF